MRIIIIGEYSSFAKNLSAGFKMLGHDSFVFSWGDGFKKIKQDKEFSFSINIGSLGKSANIWQVIWFELRSIIASLKLKRYVFHMSKKEKWDAALIVNPAFIKRKNAFWQAKFTKSMIESLLYNRSHIYMSACGWDVPYFDYWKDHPWKNEPLVKIISPKYSTFKEINHFQRCMSFIDKVIPVMYAYAEAWRYSSYSCSCRVLQTIPLPVDTSRYEEYNIIGEKVVVFHGIIRPDEKGTPIIVKAMEKLQKKYPNQVECIAKGGMSLDEYLQLLKKTNILIDQAYADSVGLNGLYAMAMGKVVLGGNVPENQKEFGEYNCPIINIEPNSEQIFNNLEELILNKERIKELSIKSRRYVERVHDSKVIAQKYIQVFQQESGGSSK